jgi:integrase
MSRNLTDSKIRGLKSAPKAYKSYDGEGLYLEIYPNGSKLWRLRYHVGGRETRKSLGEYPEVTLLKARNTASDFLRSLKNAPKDQAETQPLPLAVLGTEYLDRHRKSVKPRTMAEYSRVWENHILPRLGEMDAKDLKAKTVLTHLAQPLEKAGLIQTAHLSVSLLGRMLRLGVATGQCERDCTRDLQGALVPWRHTHRPATTDPKEIAGILQGIDSERPSENRDILRILPYVFTRPGELAGAAWAEFSLDEATWRIPAEKMKCKRPHIVPLATQVVEMFSALRDKGTGKGQVFPGRNNVRPGLTLPKVLARAIGHTGIIVPHGFRAMASTILNEKGYRPDWIERQLAHVEGNAVRAAYNHAEYLPERRKMMQDWADYLDSLKAGD